MGLLSGIIRLVSALSLVIGGYLWDKFGYRVAALIVSRGQRGLLADCLEQQSMKHPNLWSTALLILCWRDIHS
jgi:hypothetical protein